LLTWACPRTSRCWASTPAWPFPSVPCRRGDLPGHHHSLQGAAPGYLRDNRRLEEEIEITVVHEIAHYFGISEERLEELGYA
jgi:hypothetical protein